MHNLGASDFFLINSCEFLVELNLSLSFIINMFVLEKIISMIDRLRSRLKIRVYGLSFIQFYKIKLYSYAGVKKPLV